MVLACLKGAGWQSGDAVCLWIPSLTGLEGLAQRNGDLGCLYLWCGRPWVRGPAEHRSCRPVWAWRARPSRTEIMHVCIPGVAGLAGKVQQNGDCAGLCRPEGMAWQRS
jgi:hypothetical protein